MWRYLFLSVIFPASVFAQKTDSAYIQPFQRKNTFELYSGTYSTTFKFRTHRNRQHNYKLAVNSSGYLGGDVSYKWLYLQYSVNIPGTELDNKAKYHYRLIRMQFGSHAVSVEPFYNAYNGLLIPNHDHRGYEAFQGIDFTNAGLDLFYYINHKKYSYKAATSFSEQQLQSAGAVFLAATPLWHQISWRKPTPHLISDSSTYNLLSSNPSWLSLVFKGGYTHNIVLGQHKWIIAPAVMFGAGALHELNTNNYRLQAVTDMQGWINGGYNGDKYYAYLNASWENLNTNLLVKDMHRTDWNLGFTLGYRFAHLPKKILGIL
ncbi:DUF4421 family protein [Chitinophaga sancti]|uniref:DUF4421 family protein n=1 Tax=Chitinophaga sancti TaxID=1004 RepID=UPI002A74A604|nr:DUF4421 family protein [Chitinophaga sancti]WPQ61514.1 DUF4421 family protein [Chitinophaga sancti]